MSYEDKPFWSENDDGDKFYATMPNGANLCVSWDYSYEEWDVHVYGELECSLGSRETRDKTLRQAKVTAVKIAANCKGTVHV